MKLTGILQNIKLGAIKYSPEIALIGGVVSIGCGVVFACKATRKIDSIIEPTVKEIDVIHNYVNENPDNPEYTEADAKKDLAITYIKSGLKVFKLYAPSIAFGIIGFGLIFYSHGIMRNRCATLSAAYTTLTTAFNEYRSRVADKIGVKEENDIFYGITESIDENGNAYVETNPVIGSLDDEQLKNYNIRVFDKTNPCWVKDHQQNNYTIDMVERLANDKLDAFGWLDLNTVLSDLGFEKTKLGQMTGWVKSNDPNHKGDNYISFRKVDMREKYGTSESVIMLDFNVDGSILEFIPEVKNK